MSQHHLHRSSSRPVQRTTTERQGFRRLKDPGAVFSVSVILLLAALFIWIGL